MSRNLIVVACLLSCGGAIIGSLNHGHNHFALASPSSSSSSGPSAINQQQPEELVDQLTDVSQRDSSSSSSNNNNNNNNDQTIFDQQQQYRSSNEQAPLYSYLRGSSANSASFMPPFATAYVMTPSQGTNGNNNNNNANLYLPVQRSFLSHASPQQQFGQLEPFDFDSINWNAANLMREGRAYKPKIMSTARGFGKRSFVGGYSSMFDNGKLSHGLNQRHVTYADLMASANPTNNYAINNNLSGHGISSKYADWINQALARYPTLGKHVNSKYSDYNGDGIITSEEKYQSL